MSPANWSLLIGALVAIALSWRQPRAFLWIVLAACDYAASVTYWRAGLPYAEGFAGLCDALVCLSIYFIARERWELGVYRLFQISVAVNTLFLAGNLGIFYRIDIDAYSILLEALNWLTILLIGGTGVAQWVGTPIAAARRPWDRFRGALRSLREARKTPAFHRIK